MTVAHNFSSKWQTKSTTNFLDPQSDITKNLFDNEIIKEVKFASIVRPSSKQLLIPFLSLFFSFLFLFCSFYFEIPKCPFFFNIFINIIIFFGTFSLIVFLHRILVYFIFEPNEIRFSVYILANGLDFLSFALSFGANYLFLNFLKVDPSCFPIMSLNMNSDDFYFIKRVFLFFSITLMICSVVRIPVVYIRFQIYKSYYHERIFDNREKMMLLKELNRVVDNIDKKRKSYNYNLSKDVLDGELAINGNQLSQNGNLITQENYATGISEREQNEMVLKTAQLKHDSSYSKEDRFITINSNDGSFYLPPSSLSTIYSQKPSDSYQQRSAFIFHTLTEGDTDILVEEDFIRIFGLSNGSAIFSVFDENKDNSICLEEFIMVYTSIYADVHNLLTALEQNRKSINKLEIVSFSLLVPVCFYLLLTISSNESHAQKILVSVFTTILSVSFIFNRVASDMFKSILYIFGVRPFDVGDCITLDGKDYIVHELGLLYSTLLSDSRYTSVPNSKLSEGIITNLKKSKSITEKLVFVFVYDSIRDKIKMLKNDIEEFLVLNGKIFHQQCLLYDLKFVNQELLKMKIEVKVRSAYQDIKTAKQRKDLFIIFLHERFEKLGIKQVEHAEMTRF